MTRRRTQNDIFGLCQRPAVRKRGDAPAGFCAEKTGLKTRRAGVLAGGPRLSKAKARQAKTSAPVGPMTGRAVSPEAKRRAPGQRGRPQPSSASSPFSLSSPSSSSMGCHACPNFTSLKSAVSPVICLRRRSSSLSMPRCFAIHASERPSS